ncbi:hypothetical protein PAMP_010077 [Pampus punctatissimus]
MGCDVLMWNMTRGTSLLLHTAPIISHSVQSRPAMASISCFLSRGRARSYNLHNTTCQQFRQSFNPLASSGDEEWATEIRWKDVKKYYRNVKNDPNVMRTRIIQYCDLFKQQEPCCYQNLEESKHL